MPDKELTTSYEGITALLGEVRKCVIKGNFEGMKNTFLGGMRDGESYGLRKWLSKNGGALKICNDVELIWGALRELPREEETTKELASILRPKAKHALQKLQGGVPKAYQEVSTAHPYLPFFHRLECALKGLSEFDPEEDNVICIDDSDDEEEEVVHIPVPTFKVDPPKMNLTIILDNDSVDGSVDNEYKCPKCTKINKAPNNGKCSSCAQDERTPTIVENSFDPRTGNAFQLAQYVDNMTELIEIGKAVLPPNIDYQDFWNLPHNYTAILKTFRGIILHCNSKMNLIDHAATSQEYHALIKNPLCFREIVVALSDCRASGEKSNSHTICPILKRWNVFEGKYLIQAIDLVFLNHLAFLGDDLKVARKYIEHQRSYFWRKLREVSPEKKNMPVRRTETSDFVIRRS
jgi:hypothetical protein